MKPDEKYECRLCGNDFYGRCGNITACPRCLKCSGTGHTSSEMRYHEWREKSEELLEKAEKFGLISPGEKEAVSCFVFTCKFFCGFAVKKKNREKNKSAEFALWKQYAENRLKLYKKYTEQKNTSIIKKFINETARKILAARNTGKTGDADETRKHRKRKRKK